MSSASSLSTRETRPAATTSRSSSCAAEPRVTAPRKRLGQHFLSDQRILTRIADTLRPTAGETIVEIGPGRGALTELLRGRGRRLVAVELDGELAARLRVRYADDPTVEIVEQDVLDVNLGALAGADYVVVGNVPYYITTPILFHVLRAPRPARAVFLVQAEVAARVVSPPGSKTYGALSVNVQAVATADVVFRVPAGAFVPPPKVESAVLRVVPRATPLVSVEEEARFKRFVLDVFGLRRKQLGRVIRTVARLDADASVSVIARVGLAPDARPEVLPPEAFVSLFRELASLPQDCLRGATGYQG
ncbi:MAG: 16S rRNA (adenine(1518)-N(6)/adenine(1519)-N(6)) -dimethyltransferase RsmA [Gemmatimonadaceae bacterium]